MNYAPAITSARTKESFAVGGHTAALLCDIVSCGPVEYRYIVVVFAGTNLEPRYYVTSEVNKLAGPLGGGSHFLCFFDGGIHLNLGDSDDWADEVKFKQEALRIIQGRIGNGSRQKDDSNLPDTSEYRLIEPISEAELERLNTKFRRYEALGAKWQEFLGRRRDEDTLWRYWDEVFGVTGIAIVRSGVQVDRFNTFGDL